MTLLFKSWCMISSPFFQHLQKVLSLSLSLSHCNFILILQEKTSILDLCREVFGLVTS